MRIIPFSTVEESPRAGNPLFSKGFRLFVSIRNVVWRSNPQKFIKNFFSSFGW